MKWRQIAIMMCSMILVTSCTKHAMEHEEAELPLGDIPTESRRDDWKYPYGPGYEHLAGADAETVARTALEKLCSFTPEELDADAVVDRINGVVHPPLWSEISSDPSLVVPIVPGRMAGDWELSGGETKATVLVSAEQHPPDTDNSWSRKMNGVREWSGFEQPFWDLYLVTVTKREDSWRLDQLKLLSTVAGPQLTTTSTPDP